MNNVDVVIMVTKKDLNILKISVPYIEKYIQPTNIVCVGNCCLKNEIEDMGCIFNDENLIIEGLNYKCISELIIKRGGSAKRTGWYFQQFLKMAYSTVCKNEFYIVWDADTIPLQKLDYFKNDKFLFMTKKEYHAPYFFTISKLFNNNVKRINKDTSFIAENMVIDKILMQEMISKIEANKSISGDRFFEIIINAIELDALSKSGFSEFETFGNYVTTYHMEKVELIRRKALRIGAYICGYHPSTEQLSWLSQYYEIVSIENKSSNILNTIWATWFSVFTRNRMFRKLFYPHGIAKFCFSLMKVQALLRGRTITIDYDLDK